MTDLNSKRIEEEMENISLLSVVDAAQEKQLRIAKKLHTQFGHKRSETLVDTTKNAGVKNQSFLKVVAATEENCETCKRYKKLKS